MLVKYTFIHLKSAISSFCCQNGAVYILFMSKFDQFDFNQALPLINEDTEFFPLMSPEDEEEMNNEQTPEVLSILPLRNTVLFPGVVIPITVGRDKSIKLIKDAYKGDKTIGVVAQKDGNAEDPSFTELNAIGTVAIIVKMLQMPDGNTTVIIQGKTVLSWANWCNRSPILKLLLRSLKKYGQKLIGNLKLQLLL